jgi:hypothetical protein
MASDKSDSDLIEIDNQSSTSSDIWKTSDYFTIDESDNKLKCKKCSQKYVKKVSTITLKKHVKQHILSKSQTTLNQFIKLQSNQEAKTFRERLIEFIVCGQHAFSIVDQSEFKKLFETSSERIEIPSSKTIQRDIIKSFSDYRNKLIEIFKNIEYNIAITTDIWTSMSAHSLRICFQLSSQLILS